MLKYLSTLFYQLLHSYVFYSTYIKYKEISKNAWLAYLFCIKWAVQELKNCNIVYFSEISLEQDSGNSFHKGRRIKFVVKTFKLSKN